MVGIGTIMLEKLNGVKETSGGGRDGDVWSLPEASAVVVAAFANAL